MTTGGTYTRELTVDHIAEWNLVQAARYLEVAPWELAGRPSYWRDLALDCLAAERHAQNNATPNSRNAR